MTRIALVAVLLICFFAGGILIGRVSSHDTETSNPPTIATVEISPSGLPYCPADPSVPHPVPCLAKP